MFLCSKERRYKKIFINRMKLLNIFSDDRVMKSNDCITFINYKLPNLPEDVEIVNIQYEHIRCGFAIIIYSKEYPIVDKDIPILEWNKNYIIKEEEGKWIKINQDKI